MQKMEAMKRAYAEMILNTAKEAAARVMAAEIRSRRMEQELVSVKEEAANMLLRLKQMIDMKTKEAEMSSLDQKNKFGELECQLNEAEGIILDLREELNQGQEQLDLLKKNKVVLKKQNEENKDDCSLLSEINERDEFKDGCSLRNSAVSASLVAGTFSDVEKLNESGSCTNVESVKAVERTLLGENIQYGNNVAASIIRRSVRKRKLKFWDDVISACGLRSSHQFKKPRQGSADLPCRATHKLKRCVKQGDNMAEGRSKIQSLDTAEVSKEQINTETVPENMKLIEVLVKQDELAATFELTSASRIECEMEDGKAANASNTNNAEGSKSCKYTFNRKWRKKSVIYPEKVLDRAT